MTLGSPLSRWQRLSHFINGVAGIPGLLGLMNGTDDHISAYMFSNEPIDFPPPSGPFFSSYPVPYSLPLLGQTPQGEASFDAALMKAVEAIQA